MNTSETNSPVFPQDFSFSASHEKAKETDSIDQKINETVGDRLTPSIEAEKFGLPELKKRVGRSGARLGEAIELFKLNLMIAQQFKTNLSAVEIGYQEYQENPNNQLTMFLFAVLDSNEKGVFERFESFVKKTKQNPLDTGQPATFILHRYMDALKTYCDRDDLSESDKSSLTELINQLNFVNEILVVMATPRDDEVTEALAKKIQLKVQNLQEGETLLVPGG